MSYDRKFKHTNRQPNKKKLNFFTISDFQICNIFQIQCQRLQIFQTLKSFRLNNLSLKYERFTPSGCTDIGIIKLVFVAKTQLLTTIHIEKLGEIQLINII